MTSAAARRPGRIYGIADVGRLGSQRLPDAIEVMAACGIETIQVRAKRTDDRTLEAICQRVFERLRNWRGELWIDDRVDLARIHDFSGVHLGQRDLPPVLARPLLRDKKIGWSTHSVEQVRAAEEDECVDWVAFGPVFVTTSKEDPDAVVGLDGLRAARHVTRKPLIAIGGIDWTNLTEVLATGADGAAVLSAICDGDVGVNCRRLCSSLRPETT